MALSFIPSDSLGCVAHVKESMKSCARKLHKFDLIVRYVFTVQNLANYAYNLYIKTHTYSEDEYLYISYTIFKAFNANLRSK